MTRRSPSQYNLRKLQVDETILKKHFTAPRRKKVKFVVAHHMTILGTGDGRANDACYRTWQSRQASAHYGVDGKYIRQFVWDSNAAWSTANTEGNHAGISIEHANLTAGPRWKISETTWKTGAMLAAYIHLAYGLGRPTSKRGGKSGTLRTHSSFFATACPGPYFATIWDAYVHEAQRVYDQIVKGVPTPKPIPVIRPNPKPKPQWARYFEHRHLNTWGDDGAKGTNTLGKRRPVMMRDLVKGSPEVITLNEVRPQHARGWIKGFEDRGYRVPLAKDGNLVAVLNSAVTEVGWAGSTVLPKSVQGEGRAEAIGRVRIKVNGHWHHIGVGHFDYRDNTKKKNFDALRVKQALSAFGYFERFGVTFKLPTWKTRTSFGVDSNSNQMVTDALAKKGWKAVVRNWVDAIYSARTTISTDVIETDSDHKILSATYGKAVA